MTTFTRRVALKLMGLGTACLGIRRASAGNAQVVAPGAEKLPTEATQEIAVQRWANTQDRVWIGESVWANPMENWCIADGAAECLSFGPNRNLQLITHELQSNDKPFSMSVTVEQVEAKGQNSGVGFRIGVRSDINEYRSNCFASGGWNAGIVGDQLLLAGKRKPLAEGVDSQNFTLRLSGQPEQAKYLLTLKVLNTQGAVVDSLTQYIEPDQILGNVALFHNLAPAGRGNQQAAQQGQGARYRFRDWKVGGEAFSIRPERTFGPILWSMYSLSNSRTDEGYVLKLSALTGPLGEADNPQVELQFEKNGNWEHAAFAQLDPDAWVATFRLPRWNEKEETPYRVLYHETLKDGTFADSEWSGTIKANPTGRPLRLGALTCQNDYAFPYEPVAENLVKLDPDMLYFSGDQIYENHGGYGIIREPAEPAILNYLRKFYQFGWSFREAMRSRPTLCIPDDHDVFQGNIWGEAGAKMQVGGAGGASSKGGYLEPARMVNVVHKTCVSHHPDFYDPTPVQQEISVYYGDMVYGDVGFAVIADRQWKSGPERVDTGSGRADHVPDPDFDTSTLNAPGLVLLGERQEEFLKQWGEDWRGHSIKVLLSQTVFAGVATHHGKFDDYLKADLDSGGWPQTARNRTISIIRKSKALHINGDQHLTTLCQYGVDQQRDSNWSFCTPAIAVGYPRWWRPDELGMPHQDRPEHQLPDTGKYIDGLGNKVYVYAVGNPEVGTEKNRYQLAHQKGSGFGLVTIDPVAKTYVIKCFRFLSDPINDAPDQQFPGWPVTIHQAENAGENRIR